MTEGWRPPRLVRGPTQLERRRRVVYVAVALVAGGAAAAFALTMSLTASYPSRPAPPGLSREAMEHAAD